jgi:protein-S-isoprenylcysteine O-methyltransferase Ste14
MARPGFKAKLTRLIPAAAERSTFVLMTNIILALIFWQWRPIEGTVWHVDSAIGAAVLHGLFWLGWGVVLISTFLIDHFHLFGLRQVWEYLQKKAPASPHFKELGLYKMVRHPIMLGFVIAFWATPDMTVARLFFAGLTTAYILVGLTFEERDLVRFHGERYLEYARRVPMLIPFLKLNRTGGRTKPGLEETPAG